MVAAPSYLLKKPEIERPEDLKELDFISFSVVPDGLNLKKLGSQPISCWGESAIITNSIQTVRRLTPQGIGLTLLPYYEVENDLKKSTRSDSSRMIGSRFRDLYRLAAQCRPQSRNP